MRELIVTLAAVVRLPYEVAIRLPMMFWQMRWLIGTATILGGILSVPMAINGEVPWWYAVLGLAGAAAAIQLLRDKKLRQKFETVPATAAGN